MTDTTEPADIDTDLSDGRAAAPRTQDEVRDARAMVPAAAPAPVQILSFQQQIELAQAMAKAANTIPTGFRGNVGDCLAVVDIALRAGLSPYMLAQQMYVQNSRLCLQSQAYHALVQTPGYLIGDLTTEYEGDGEDLVCIVTGTLATDPRTPRVHRSPPLKDVRPKRNAEGAVKGSPLWDRKPRVQLAYDTVRDWVRLYAPRATMGLYDREEMLENPEYFGPDNAKPVDGAALRGRLGTAKGQEGHRPGAAEQELENIARGTQDVRPAARRKPRTAKKNASEEPKQPETPQNAPATSAAAKPRFGRTPHPSTPEAPVTMDAINEAARPAPEITPPAKPKAPTNAREYVEYAEAWIDAEPEAVPAMQRWEGEMDMRANLSVPISIKSALRALLEKKFGIGED